MKKIGICLCTASLWVSTQAYAATYYVDSTQGNDSNSGKAETSAWKTLDRVNQMNFAPGDRVLFRGEFRGAISLREDTNGSQENPIVFDGESWGGKKAGIIGTVPWNPTWTRCTQASQVAGNPNYANIWYASAPPDWSSDPSDHHFFKPIFENGDFLWFSTGPNLADPFLFEDYHSNDSVPPSNITSTSITDADVFTQGDSSFYEGSYVGIRDSGNLYAFNYVRGYNPSSHTLQITGSWSPYSDRETTYNIMNHLAHLDRPGEYVYKYSENRIYIWPRNESDPNGNSYETAREKLGFSLNGGSHITVRGFHFEGQSDLPGEYGLGSAVSAQNNNVSTNLLIENNSITKIRAMKYTGAISLLNCVNSLVQNNTIDYCQNSVGILAQGSQDIIVRNNRIDRVSKLGIWFQDLQNGQITRNTIRRVEGLHSNGISLYLGCSNILVAGNRVWRSQNPITFRDGSDFYIIGNVLDSLEAYSIAEWSGDMGGDVFILNNVAVNANASPETQESNSSIFLVNDTSANYVIMNNVLDGILVVEGSGGAVRSHNYFTGANYTQSPSRGGILGLAEQVLTLGLNSLFANPAQEDYSPTSNGPLIDAGRDVREYHPLSQFPEYDFSTDLVGNPVGSVFNIGAYEGPDGANPLPPSNTPTPIVSYPIPSEPTPTPTVTPTPMVVVRPTNTPVVQEPGTDQTRVTVKRLITDVDIANREAEITLEITVTGPNVDLTVVESYPDGLALALLSPSPYFKQGTQMGWLLEDTGSTTLRYKVHAMDLQAVYGNFNGYYWYRDENDEVRESIEGPLPIEF